MRRRHEPILTDDDKAKILLRHSKSVATVGPDGQLDIKPRDEQPRLSLPVIPQRVNFGRREDSRHGGPSPQGSSSQDNRQLPRDASDRTTRPASQSAAVEESPAVILQRLMDKFMMLKEKGGKAEGFKALQKSFVA